MSFLFFLVYAAAAGGLLPLLESSPGSAQELKVKVSLATFIYVYNKAQVPECLSVLLPPSFSVLTEVFYLIQSFSFLAFELLLKLTRSKNTHSFSHPFIQWYDLLAPSLCSLGSLPSLFLGTPDLIIPISLLLGILRELLLKKNYWAQLTCQLKCGCRDPVKKEPVKRSAVMCDICHSQGGTQQLSERLAEHVEWKNIQLSSGVMTIWQVKYSNSSLWERWDVPQR